MNRSKLLAVAALILMPIAASAAAIPLVNSGIGGGTKMAHGSVDPNWTVTGSDSGQAIVIDQPGVYPMNGPWIGSSEDSAWLSTSRGTSAPMGTYTFSTSFDLTGMDFSTASISGRFAADNEASIWLNGVDTGIQINDEAFRDWHDFAITSGFIDGINTLDFVVNNIHENSPLGVRVEMTGDAGIGGGQVPEPSSVLVLGLGLAAAYLHRRRTSLKTA